VFVLALFRLTFAASREKEIVVNEDTLMDSCTSTCEDIPTINVHSTMVESPYYCEKVWGCSTMSNGWTRGFVRCDYCKCKCLDNRAVVPEIVKKTTKKELTEPNLYGTCTGTCSKSGLVRTNWEGCDEVRNCERNRKGWIRGFVRCDYCACDCVRHLKVNSYKMVDVRYDTSNAALDPGTIVGMAELVVKNEDYNTDQSVEQALGWTYEESQSLETEISVVTGLSVEVEAGVDIKLFTGSVTTTASLETGYTTTTGKVDTFSRENSLASTLNIPPRRRCSALVVGKKRKVDIPYTAVLVTIYDDNTEDRTNIEGTYNAVEMSDFHVTYPRCEDLDSEYYSHSECVFPFEFQGDIYNSCTKVDHDGYWCATVDKYSKGTDSYRDCHRCDEGLHGSKGSGYRGCQARTRSGKLCQAWSSQSPHKHDITSANYPDSGLESNYCRNPDGGDTIWCYTTDASSRFEYCDPL